MSRAPRLLKTLKLRFLLGVRDLHNALLARRPRIIPSRLPELNEIAERARTRTDFSDHLLPLFAEALAARPRLIVELGTRGGESTFVLERAARLCGSRFVSVDLDDCAGASAYSGWEFVRADDVAFAAGFPAWCAGRDLAPAVDLLFIDTSHLYEHTLREIDAWFPHLAPRAKVIFHDTHMRPRYVRQDGSYDYSGWDNDRGVIRALEDRLGGPFDETRDFIEVRGDWVIRHTAACNGFTVLDRWR